MERRDTAFMPVDRRCNVTECAQTVLTVTGQRQHTEQQMSCRLKELSLALKVDRSQGH